MVFNSHCYAAHGSIVCHMREHNENWNNKWMNCQNSHQSHASIEMSTIETDSADSSVSEREKKKFVLDSH